MVTQYLAKDGILVGARPFYAALLAGDASGSDANNKFIEQFLRAAEPPAHDRWVFTDDLREMYERGAKSRLDEFLGPKLNEALRRVLRVPTRSESDGPPELKKLLSLGGTEREAAAVLRNIRPRFESNRWIIKADVLLKRKDEPLTIQPYVALNVETGRPVRLEWESLELFPTPGVEFRDGRFFAGGKVTRFTFKGTTKASGTPVAPSRCTARVALSMEKP
jgi:RNA polymerase primary sigma factor